MRKRLLMRYYEAMRTRLGPSCWWPAQSPFEVVVGAILTQNTAWKNVELALERLRQREVLHPRKIYELSSVQLEDLIRPSGFYKIKARRLKAFLDFLFDLGGDAALDAGQDLSCLHDHATASLRVRLLDVKGIGPETADSILLYALQRPVFVVDAYTKRIFCRHAFLPDDADYAEVQAFFADVLPEDVMLYNEFHALIVRICVAYCKKTSPLCDACPLYEFLEYAPE